jgi:hypothetical protein
MKRQRRLEVRNDRQGTGGTKPASGRRDTARGGFPFKPCQRSVFALPAQWYTTLPILRWPRYERGQSAVVGDRHGDRLSPPSVFVRQNHTPARGHAGPLPAWPIRAATGWCTRWQHSLVSSATARLSTLRSAWLRCRTYPVSPSGRASQAAREKALSLRALESANRDIDEFAKARVKASKSKKPVKDETD